MEKDKKRGLRRARTEAVCESTATRVRNEWRWWKPTWAKVPHLFAKLGMQTHGRCSKKSRSSGKRGRGACHAFDARAAVELRQAWRLALCRQDW